MVAVTCAHKHSNCCVQQCILETSPLRGGGGGVGGAQSIGRLLESIGVGGSGVPIRLWEFILGFNTRRYTLIHGFCFYKLFLWALKSY